MTEHVRFSSLDEFWPSYISQHMRRGNRRLHFIGTTMGLLCLAAAALFGDWRFLVLGLVLSYGFAWTGHFFIERNAPATFRHPVLSFRADFRMYGFMFAKKMESEIVRLKEQVAPHSSAR
ncbi:MAG TPA: DUF962 domain-containing protein [Elusimicrobiota bacterium]|nr:DUF962 domain-containing protein [Elusimicrobiota bacterium]